LAAELRECLGDPSRLERTQACAARLKDLLVQPTHGSVVDWMLHRLA
jgi:lipid-A-disaccharide synthase